MINIQNFKILILIAFITFSNVQSEELRFLNDNVDIVNDVNVSKDVGVSIHNKVNELKDSDKSDDLIYNRSSAAGCYRVIDDKSCKNASSSSTCTLFAADYKTGSCERNGYSVACSLRYGIILMYKDNASCDGAQEKALHSTGTYDSSDVMNYSRGSSPDKCYRIIDDKTCKDAAESSSCVTFADSYKSGTCANNGYSVKCSLKYGIIINYKNKSECEDARGHALFSSKNVDRCHRITGDKYCKEDSEPRSCSEPIYNFKSGSCESNGFGVECALRYGSILYYKTKAECKAAQDKALH
jgi:hypothetical protein